MAKYRKKTVEIEAFKWTGDINQTEEPIWIVEAIQKGDVWCREDSKNGYTVMTIANNNSVMTANRGDYIIKGVKGEIYPCKPEIFEMTYEAVEERKDCGSENNEELNEIVIICDGESIVVETPLTIEDVAKGIYWYKEKGSDFIAMQEYFSNSLVFFNPKKVTSIKYSNL